MEAPRRVLVWLTAMLSLSGFVVHGRADEPQVAFTFKAGWVEVMLRHDGKPIDGAAIQILEEGGAKFADGETGPDGETAFPLPPGSSCIVEIKTGAKTADPIRLLKTDNGVEPARVLLSYGLRPCCRSLISRPERDTASDFVAPPRAQDHSAYLWTGGAAMLGGVGILMVQACWLRRRSKM